MKYVIKNGVDQYLNTQTNTWEFGHPTIFHSYESAMRVVNYYLDKGTMLHPSVTIEEVEDDFMRSDLPPGPPSSW